MIALTILNTLILAVVVWLLQQVRQETDRKIAELSERHGDLESSLNAQRAGTERLEDAVREIRQDQIDARLEQVSDESTEVEYEDPIPYLEEETPSQVLEMANRLAVLRPLVPYPGWHFDADWRNPEMAFRVRQSIWTYFNRRKLAPALDVGWHHGTRARIYPGNDLSRQLFIAGCIDPNEFVLLDKLLLPGMVFLDVGANEGLYSLFASVRVGPSGSVWAFEPSKREIERIAANLELNNLRNVHSLPIALADRDGEGSLLIAGYEHEGHNTLGGFVYDTVLQEEYLVPLRRLDSVVDEWKIDRVDFIKIDVEGAELKVLAGAQETLQRCRPLILFEANSPALQQQGADNRELIRFLTDRRFRIYVCDPATGFPALAEEGCFSDNMLAVPDERTLPGSVFRSTPAAAPGG